MPAAKMTTTPKASKRTPVTSTCKCKADKNAAAKQHERAAKKASTKAHKVQCKEAGDNDILVGHNGESPRLQKLCTQAMLLKSKNQCLKAKIKHCNEHKKALPVKLIPKPTSKISAKIDSLCANMGMAGDEHNVEWSFLWAAFCTLLVAVGLDWEKSWSKQDIGKINTLIQAAENKYPQFRCFKNHWGLIFLLQECFGNIHAYKQKLARLSPCSDSDANEDTNKPTLPTKHRCLNNTNVQDSNDAETCLVKMAKSKLAAHHLYKHHAAKLHTEPHLWSD